MAAPGRYTHADEREIEDAFRAGDALTCPRCGATLDLRPVPPRTDVSYVRERLIVVCSSCHRTHVLDLKQAP
jgi:hypothetical protein